MDRHGSAKRSNSTPQYITNGKQSADYCPEAGPGHALIRPLSKPDSNRISDGNSDRLDFGQRQRIGLQLHWLGQCNREGIVKSSTKTTLAALMGGAVIVLASALPFQSVAAELSPGDEASEAVRHGAALAEANCAKCHAVGIEGERPPIPTHRRFGKCRNDAP